MSKYPIFQFFLFNSGITPFQLYKIEQLCSLSADTQISAKNHKLLYGVISKPLKNADVSKSRQVINHSKSQSFERSKSFLKCKFC